MDLELTDEQGWLSEAVETLLEREWPSPERLPEADTEQRRRLWRELVAFGALSAGTPDGLGTVDACLIAHALGRHLAAVPFTASVATRLALARDVHELSALLDTHGTVALAVVEPGGGWEPHRTRTRVDAANGSPLLTGEKVAVEQAELADLLAVQATAGGAPALAFVATDSAALAPRASFDPTLPTWAASFAAAPTTAVLSGYSAGVVLARLHTAGALLAAAEAIGAAERVLAEACRYAGERRQFGHRIATFQALRHLLADMHVRVASGWSSILYAAAAFDDDAADGAMAAAVAKAYVSRAALEVAHGAMQVFGGIAFTDEHPAHRFLRRIVVRGQQFGDAAHHERALGRLLAAGAITADAAARPRVTVP